MTNACHYCYSLFQVYAERVVASHAFLATTSSRKTGARYLQAPLPCRRYLSRSA